jgi:SAM-dependent methyltransferase
VNNQALKEQVRIYWNQASCGTEVAQASKGTAEYYAQIEAYRYAVESEIFSFAQFTRWHKKKVLEVGVGAGTDFLQWARAGAYATGIDLTAEAVEHVKNRLALENLSATVQVADAENLPFADNSFDLVWSWGVIHHSPNTLQCLKEIVRVTKPGGTVKIMIYHRYSLFAFYRYLLAGLFKGKPFRSLSDVLFYDQESLGTKAYSFKEARQMIAQVPVKVRSLSAPATKHDLLFYKHRFFQMLASVAASILGRESCGFFMMIELQK